MYAESCKNCENFYNLVEQFKKMVEAQWLTNIVLATSARKVMLTEIGDAVGAFLWLSWRTVFSKQPILFRYVFEEGEASH